MKVTVTFGDTAVVVPCKAGWIVKDLIEQATRRYRRILEQVNTQDTLSYLLYFILPLSRSHLLSENRVSLHSTNSFERAITLARVGGHVTIFERWWVGGGLAS